MTATGIMSANEHNQQHLKRLHVFVHVGMLLWVCTLAILSCACA